MAKLEEQGQMTELGREKIAEAKENGQWENATRPSAVTDEQIAEVAVLLTENAEAAKNFANMSSSVRKPTRVLTLMRKQRLEELAAWLG